MSNPERATKWAAATAGVCAAAAGLAVTELVAAIGPRAPSLLSAVDQFALRRLPGATTRRAIDSLGTNDKPVLLAASILVALALGAGLGLVAVRHWRVAVLGIIGTAASGALAAVSLPAGSTSRALMSGVLATLAAVVVLRVLVDRAPLTPMTPTASTGALSRRRFLLIATATGAAAFAGGALSRVVLAARSVAETARARIRLPAPADAASVDPHGLGQAGLTPLVTANADFYRIDEALDLPDVDVVSWRLRVTGLVDQPLTLAYDDLLAMPLRERYVTLTCVSNEVGDSLVGNARWLGVPLDALLARAGVQPGADQIVGRSVDGFTVGMPTAVALDGRDSLVAVAMNGEPLPVAHGFPARLVVPGLYGYVSATKWLTELELTTFDAYDAYWVQRGWAREGPVKPQSRIDVPRTGAAVRAGPVTVAGVAWAQHDGVAGVEVRVDDGAWQSAELGEELSADTWRQWRLQATLAPGSHVLRVRATTSTGVLQSAEQREPFPDGATGYHAVVVDAG